MLTRYILLRPYWTGMKTDTMFLCWGRKESDKEEQDTKWRETAVAPTLICLQQPHHQPPACEMLLGLLWTSGATHALAPSPQPIWAEAAVVLAQLHPAAPGTGSRPSCGSSQRHLGTSGVCSKGRWGQWGPWPLPSECLHVSTHSRRATPWIKITFSCMGTSWWLRCFRCWRFLTREDGICFDCTCGLSEAWGSRRLFPKWVRRWT